MTTCFASYKTKENNLNSILIEDPNGRKVGNSFQGDVLVVYKATLDRVNKICEVLCVNLMASKVEMTITLNVVGNLIQNFEEKIVVGSRMLIIGFQIVPKIYYDHGDSDCILIL